MPLSLGASIQVQMAAVVTDAVKLVIIATPHYHSTNQQLFSCSHSKAYRHSIWPSGSAAVITCHGGTTKSPDQQLFVDQLIMIMHAAATLSSHHGGCYSGGGAIIGSSNHSFFLDI